MANDECKHPHVSSLGDWRMVDGRPVTVWFCATCQKDLTEFYARKNKLHVRKD